MAEYAQTARLTSQSGKAEPTAAELLDPVALEARLVEARARRAEALAKRGAEAGPTSRAPTAVAEIRKAPARSPADQSDGDLSAAPQRPLAAPETLEAQDSEQRSADDGRRGRRSLLFAGVLAAGFLGALAGALLAPPDLRHRIAAIVAPADPADPADGDAQNATGSGVTDAPASVPPTTQAVVQEGTAAGPETAASAAPTVPETLPSVPGLEDRAQIVLPSPQPDAAAFVTRASTSPTSSPTSGLRDPETRRLRSSSALSSQVHRPGSPELQNDLFQPDPESRPHATLPEMAATASDLIEVAPIAASLSPIGPRDPSALTADLPDASQIFPPISARVVVHHPPSAADASAAVVAALIEAGAPEVTSVPVQFTISRTNARFFHSTDRDSATAIVDLIATQLGDDQSQVRDFTDFQPRPEQGFVEVWLAGDGPPAAQAGRTTAPVSAPPQAAVIRPPENVGRAEPGLSGANRLLLQRDVERLLRSQLRRN